MSEFRQALRQELLETDEEFRRLYEEHRRFDRRLQELLGKAAATDDEELLVKGLKVQKLHLKDRMEAILRTHL